MKTIDISPHITNIRIKVHAQTIELLFTSSLERMNRILCKNYEKYFNKHTFAKDITITAEDSTTMLLEFLSGILTLTYTNRAIFHTIAQFSIIGNILHVHVLGTRINKFDEQVKAVTYHEAEVKQNESGEYETMIVFTL